MSQLALDSLVGNARGRLGRASKIELTGTQFRLFFICSLRHTYPSLPIVFVVNQVVGAEDS